VTLKSGNFCALPEAEFCTPPPSEHGGKLVEVLANDQISDLEKLSALTALIQEPQQAVAPLLAPAALTNDVESKQALRLLAEDELSTATWLHQIYQALTAAQASSPVSEAAQQ
jgi:hypothetical protein